MDKFIGGADETSIMYKLSIVKGVSFIWHPHHTKSVYSVGVHALWNSFCKRQDKSVHTDMFACFPDNIN